MSWQGATKRLNTQPYKNEKIITTPVSLDIFCLFQLILLNVQQLYSTVFREQLLIAQFKLAS